MDTKALIYARVSSREQEETGYSLDAQEKLLKEYGGKNTINVVKVFRVSESASGKQIRKTFNEMLQYARTHGIHIILCEKIDRLTRNLKDAASISDWISEDERNEVHFVKESFVVNKNTRAHENLVWDMKVAIARFYTNNLSEEVKKGQKEKLSQGQFPARAKIGYVTTGEKGHKNHIIDPVMAPLVQKAFELYSTGNYSVKALVEIMYTEGLRGRTGKKIGKSRLYDILSESYYYGAIEWGGKLTPGKHDPLITKELFDSVQSLLNRKFKVPQYKKHLPVFKAKISCEECGGIITWETQKGHWYGHCAHYKSQKCTQNTYLRQEKVEEKLFPYFDNVAPKNSRVVDWLKRAIRESHTEEIHHNDLKREEFDRIIKMADQRIERAYCDKLDGRMPLGLCEKVIGDSTREKEDAIEALGKLSKGRTAYYEAGLALHELASQAEAIYQSPKATTEEKRLLLSHVFTNLTLKGADISPNYTFAFEFLAEWTPKLNLISELAENSSTKGKENAFASSHPVLLAWWDSFRTFEWERALHDPGVIARQIDQLTAVES